MFENSKYHLKILWKKESLKKIVMFNILIFWKFAASNDYKSLRRKLSKIKRPQTSLWDKITIFGYYL